MISEGDRQLLARMFLADAAKHVRVLKDRVAELPAAKDGAAEPWATVFRIAHSMKSDARLVGFGSLSKLASAVEDLLDHVRHGRLEMTPSLVDTVAAAVEGFEVLVVDASNGIDSFDQARLELVARLERAAAARLP